MSGLSQSPEGAGETNSAADGSGADLSLRTRLAAKDADLTRATVLLNDMERRFIELQTQLSSQQDSASEHNGTVEKLSMFSVFGTTADISIASVQGAN
jgi:hypothetical protein